MNKTQSSAVFGLNFLQDMKGDARPITGAYDPEQGLWVSKGPVLAGSGGNEDGDGSGGNGRVTNETTQWVTGPRLVQTSHPGDTFVTIDQSGNQIDSGPETLIDW